MKRALLLTGQPGTGKTALVKEALAISRPKAGGFYTEEIRTGGVRRGFKIVTLDGHEAILAHVDISGPYRVGRYGVDIDALNSVAVAALRQALRERDLIVVDEIGKMELLSSQFQEVAMQVLDSGHKVLGTIMLNPHPFADRIKRHAHVEVILLTRDNRAEAMRKVMDWLEKW